LTEKVIKLAIKTKTRLDNFIGIPDTEMEIHLKGSVQDVKKYSAKILADLKQRYGFEEVKEE
jgi:hypothetical protein